MMNMDSLSLWLLYVFHPQITRIVTDFYFLLRVCPAPLRFCAFA